MREPEGARSQLLWRFFSDLPKSNLYKHVIVSTYYLFIGRELIKTHVFSYTRIIYYQLACILVYACTPAVCLMIPEDITTAQS